MASPNLFTSMYQNISAKTAAYTVLPIDITTLFTTRGAGGSVTFTLPAIADVPTGWWVEFMCVAAQNMVIAAPTNKLTVFNNLTATSATLSTSSELIGGGFRIVFDGTTYLCFIYCEETQTVTVA